MLCAGVSVSDTSESGCACGSRVIVCFGRVVSVCDVRLGPALLHAMADVQCELGDARRAFPLWGSPLSALLTQMGSPCQPLEVGGVNNQISLTCHRVVATIRAALMATTARSAPSTSASLNSSPTIPSRVKGLLAMRVRITTRGSAPRSPRRSACRPRRRARHRPRSMNSSSSSTTLSGSHGAHERPRAFAVAQ